MSQSTSNYCELTNDCHLINLKKSRLLHYLMAILLQDLQSTAEFPDQLEKLREVLVKVINKYC